MDHIIAQKHRGPTVLDNLALCCLDCNSHKGPNIAGIDPITRALTPLFNPRRDVWHEHFEWQGAILIGITPIGRTTGAVLEMNNPFQLLTRESLIQEGLFPPSIQGIDSP
jgi:hypothetical protein